MPPHSNVPDAPGVYVVLRASRAAPTSRAVSPAGPQKRKDPTVTRERLEREWVADATVVYIGQSSMKTHETAAVSKRLDEYRRQGFGSVAGHSGGRLIWQLGDSADLLVAWHASDGEKPVDVEADLIEAFTARYGRLPFANLRRGRRRSAHGALP